MHKLNLIYINKNMICCSKLENIWSNSDNFKFGQNLVVSLPIAGRYCKRCSARQYITDNDEPHVKIAQ